ncbi:MAG: D-glucuronyl C5-epimerase family protein [Gaiellaceae bacterium]
MRLTLGATVAVTAMLFAGAAPARTPIPAQKVALNGIKQAAAKGSIDRASAAKYRAAVNRAALLIRRLPKARSTPVSACLREAAATAAKLTAPRARAVFGQLAVNNSYFALDGPPVGQKDITDVDGIVYRYFAGLGFQFHPLANFAALNARVSSGDLGGADRLAQALIARGVSEPGGGMGWEYYFDYSGGRAPWLSGMAQAVAAQALSYYGTNNASNETSSLDAARLAFLSIPGRLVQTVGPGSWIKLYGFNHSVVLNAQLQSIISLNDYAQLSDDVDAAALAASMSRSAAANLNRFDTGYWTYYALPSKPSPLSYQRYVVQMLRRLADDDPRFSVAATKFSAYEKQPPAFKLSDSATGTVRFWLSKPATVEMRSAAGATKRLSLYGGWYTLGWKLPMRAGAYSVSVSANDWAGNRASFTALPIVRVVTPPSWVVVGSAVSQSKAIRAVSRASRPEPGSTVLRRPRSPLAKV